MNVAAPLPGSIGSDSTALGTAEESLVRDPIRRIGFFVTIGLAILQYSRLHETLSFLAGGNTFLLYLLSVPALISLVLSGTLQRVLTARIVLLWLAFTVWMFVCIPFSYWRGGSLYVAFTWLKVVVPTMLFFAAFPCTWKEVRLLFLSMSFAGLVIISTSRLFMVEMSDRAGLEFGLLANSNDYAAHLIGMLPFIAFMIVCRSDWPLLGSLSRVAGLFAIPYGLYLILRSGSRGALVALAAAALYSIWKGSAKVRVGAAIAIPLIGVCLVIALPRSTVLRLISFSTTAEADQPEEAYKSALARQQFLQESIKISFTHPIFGVGPGEFTDFEGITEKSRGKRGGYINTHNSFTQISSECGLVGFFFYAAAVVSTFLLVLKTWRLVRGRPEFQDISKLCFCFAVSFIGFTVAISFLNFGYFFYFPAFTGLAIALNRATVREIALRPAPAIASRPAASNVPWSPAVIAPIPQPPPKNPYRFNRKR